MKCYFSRELKYDMYKSNLMLGEFNVVTSRNKKMRAFFMQHKQIFIVSTCTYHVIIIFGNHRESKIRISKFTAGVYTSVHAKKDACER